MEIGASLEHVSRVAVAKQMNASWLVDLGTELGRKEGMLERPGAKVAFAINSGAFGPSHSMALRCWLDCHYRAFRALCGWTLGGLSAGS
jgi:hypothetical protein